MDESFSWRCATGPCLWRSAHSRCSAPA